MIKHKPSITGRKIRLGLVGCGRIADNHFRAIAAHESEIELVGVCDIDRNALKAAVARTGAEAFPNLTALLASSEADIVTIATLFVMHPAPAVIYTLARRHALPIWPVGSTPA